MAPATSAVSPGMGTPRLSIADDDKHREISVSRENVLEMWNKPCQGAALAPVSRRALARTLRRAGAAAASAIAARPAETSLARAHAAERRLDEKRAPGELRGESAFDGRVDLLLDHEPRFARFIRLPAARREQALGASGDGQRRVGAGLRVGLGDRQRSPGETSRNHPGPLCVYARATSALPRRTRWGKFGAAASLTRPATAGLSPAARCGTG